MSEPMLWFLGYLAFVAIVMVGGAAIGAWIIQLDLDNKKKS